MSNSKKPRWNEQNEKPKTEVYDKQIRSLKRFYRDDCNDQQGVSVDLESLLHCRWCSGKGKARFDQSQYNVESSSIQWFHIHWLNVGWV